MTKYYGFDRIGFCKISVSILAVRHRYGVVRIVERFVIPHRFFSDERGDVVLYDHLAPAEKHRRVFFIIVVQKIRADTSRPDLQKNVLAEVLEINGRKPPEKFRIYVSYYGFDLSFKDGVKQPVVDISRIGKALRQIIEAIEILLVRHKNHR